MKKFSILFFLLILFLSKINPATDKAIFFNTVLSNIIYVIDRMSLDYSKLSGYYTTGGEIKGSATIGNFPSFRFGTSLGTILYRNSFGFLKDLNIYSLDYNTIIKSMGSGGSIINWFDQYFIPVPVTNYHFQIGLPLGFNAGARFNIGPIGALLKPGLAQYEPDITMWGLGANFNYAILREHKYFPSISTGFGIQYSDVKIGAKNISIGNITLKNDLNEDVNIPTKCNFITHSNNTSFFFDLSISKRYGFFQPFASLKFVQTVSHNVSKFTLGFDLSKASPEIKNTFDEKIEVSNVTSIDKYGSETGKIYSVSDFVLSAGFEFVMSIFRMGFEASYSCISQSGMLALDLRFQVEDWQFDNINKKFKKNKIPDGDKK